ncbi:hypothetical protein [Amycolatopsis minnesotensis]|uniref:Uncharacterized protein n=1 Tax=Amycolatopsis minnesotensis TaxID=337894 RepID=A0ABN2S9W0_9PSEU
MTARARRHRRTGQGRRLIWVVVLVVSLAATVLNVVAATPGNTIAAVAALVAAGFAFAALAGDSK